MSADAILLTVGSNDHRHRIPAHDTFYASFNIATAGENGLLRHRNRIDIRRVGAEWIRHAQLQSSLMQLSQQLGHLLRPVLARDLLQHILPTLFVIDCQRVYYASTIFGHYYLRLFSVSLMAPPRHRFALFWRWKMALPPRLDQPRSWPEVPEYRGNNSSLTMSAELAYIASTCKPCQQAKRHNGNHIVKLLNLFVETFTEFIPTMTAILIVIGVLVVARMFMGRRSAAGREKQFRRQIVTMLLSFVGLLVVILSLPVRESTIGQLLSLLGILLSAAIALSATTLVGNIMAGLMLRAVRNFRGGDFIHVKDHFGRVSDRGLFHVEIQTEESNLTTLPNMFLVKNPVRVIRSEGTLVTADVSLGYDIPRDRISQALIKAATAAKLKEPFVHVVNLGDFSVTYRVAGLLSEVKGLLSTRSRLREKMLDQLHGVGIEIVSPTFMNQRQLAKDKHFLAMPTKDDTATPKNAEAVVFDKAEEAESEERLLERREKLDRDLQELQKQHADMPDSPDRDKLAAQIERQKGSLKRLAVYIDSQEDKDEK
jgi:small-conductance mechanosensitive channel